MKDKLTDLFHERFAGHEADVPPGLWEAISAQVATTSGAGLQAALKDKFDGHETDVDPGVWQNISSQLGHGAAAGAGAGAATGWLAAGVAALVVGGGLLYWTLAPTGPGTTPPAPQQRTEVAVTPALGAGTDGPAAPAPSTTQPAVTENTAQDRPAPVTQSAQDRPAPTSARPAVSTIPPVGNTVTTSVPAHAQTTDRGQQTVSEVMQELMEENATRPEPAKPEPVPPPSIADVPIKPFPTAKDDAAPAAQPAEEERTMPAAEEPMVFIPNVFSPNGDGVNDRLEVTCEHCQAVEVRIFSAKTNALVFKSKDLEHAWSGQGAEDGYYFYAIEITGADGQVRSKGEVVRLFRP